MSPKKRDFLIAAGLIALVILVIVLGNVFSQDPQRMVARVRYFDGSLDTIEIRDYHLYDGTIKFTSVDGVTTISGANNVIIIKGDRPDE